MINWISSKVNDVLDRHNVSVHGFDQDCLMNAWCIVGMNGTAMGIRLGNVARLSHGEIERRFVAAMLQFALSAEEDGDNEGYELVDELLEAITRKDYWYGKLKRRTVQVR